MSFVLLQEPITDYELGKAIRWLFYIAFAYGLFWMFRNQKRNSQQNENKTNKAVKQPKVNNEVDFVQPKSRAEVDKANQKILEDIGAFSIDDLVWESINTAFQHNWCVEGHILNIHKTHLSILLLLPDDLVLPQKEKLTTYKKAILKVTDYQKGKTEFDEIDEANLLGSNINVIIKSLKPETQEIFVKPYK